MAQYANSFDNFIILVSQWLELNKRTNFFRQLVNIFSEADKITWKEIVVKLNEQKFFFTDYDKIKCNSQIGKKASVTLLPFLKEMKKYKNYPFKKVKKQKNVTATLPVTTEKTQHTTLEIQALKKILLNVNKSNSINERVLFVLNSMGLDKFNVEQQSNILKLVNTAIVQKNVDLDKAFEKTDIPSGDYPATLLDFMQLINNFVKTHTGKTPSINLLSFLCELQKSIILDTEIKHE